MPYRDMADNCEVLLMGKQNMSRLMSTQLKQECSMDPPLPNHDNELENMYSSSHIDVGFQKVIPCFKIPCLHLIFHKNIYSH